MTDLPERPPIDWPRDNPEDFDDWKDQWRTFRDRVVREVASLFEEHDEADPIASQLRRIGDRYAPDDDKPWDLVVQARAPDTLNYRYETDRTRRRRNVTRSDDAWWFDEEDRPEQNEIDTSAEYKLARRIVFQLYWWGDLDFVGLARAIKNEVVVEPDL